MADQTVRKTLDAFTSPCVSLTECDGRYYGTTSTDTALFVGLALIPPFHVHRMDDVLQRVSDAGYWLETIAETRTDADDNEVTA